MIQRIQTIHLILSALCGIAAVIISLGASGSFISADVLGGSMGWGRYAFIACMGIGAALALWSIFMYKNRMRQLKGVKLSGVFYLLSTTLMIINLIVVKECQTWSCIAMYVPVVCILFNYLASRRIKFDERLVRSADRLR